MAGILKREPSPDGRDADNFGYVNSVDEAYKLIAEFERGSTTKFSCFKADKGFGNTGMHIYIYLKALSRASLYLSRPCSTDPIFHYNLTTDHSNRSHKILWEDPRDIKGAKIRFIGVPFIILGRKVFDCQHGKDRKAGEKRKRQDAEEVNKILYCTYTLFFYPRHWCFYCHLWLANPKCQIHISLGQMTLISKYFYDNRDNSSISAKLKMV